MMKLANPFHYPLAILVGGILLVGGVRILSLPNFLILPTSVLVATTGAMFLKSREPDPEKIATKQVEQALNNLRVSSQNLAMKAEELRQEANQLLGRDADDFELLIQVQEVCDQTIELPQKIEELGKRLPRKDSILSIADLERDLQSAKNLRSSSSDIARQQAEELVKSLERNIQLTRTGQSVNQAKLLCLQKIVQDSAGLLQEFQNTLRTINPEDPSKIQELQALSERLKSFQSNIDNLIN